eukprot:TRINITY_DN7533_c0_g1_i4.p1 TRINITY_DN7533_c0_g1~~TRINITY_DN7533_c0_g1_i4.p1  ORF type:complete len:103 (+),score=1.76 TRINITY_DN7533_c0_g1_i4:173-481(+)
MGPKRILSWRGVWTEGGNGLHLSYDVREFTHAVCEVVDTTGARVYVGVVKKPSSCRRALRKRGILNADRTFRVVRGVNLSSRSHMPSVKWWTQLVRVCMLVL